MTLTDYLTSKGALFFRLRSFTPLLLVPLFYLERGHFRYPAQSHAADMAFELSCLLLSLAGIAIRVITIGFVPAGTSGRNTHRQKAEFLNTTGMYSVVRNPLYLGNYLIFLGVTLLSQSWELAIINALIFMMVYLPIIMTEEQFLSRRFEEVYAAYVSRTPCLLPNMRLWSPPERDFSFRMVLRREHDTWFALVVVFAAVEHYREYVITGAPKLESGWLTLAVVFLLLWILLKLLKQKSHLLDPKQGNRRYASGVRQ